MSLQIGDMMVADYSKDPDRPYRWGRTDYLIILDNTPGEYPTKFYKTFDLQTKSIRIIFENSPTAKVWSPA